MAKFLRIPLIVLLGLLVALAGFLWGGLPLLARQSFPQTSGEIRLSGLDGPVDIYRNSFGVPHIYASTSHDLFFAQGYVHAQDRFWQMDLWRHQGAGRLSELVGESAIEIDKFLQTLGWERVARQEVERLDGEVLDILNAYAEGVNAYLAEHQGSSLSLEYAFLGLVNPGYQPAPWSVLNTLTWTKAMAWELGGNMDSEIDRALLLKTLTPEQIAALMPAYNFGERPVIVNHPHMSGGEPAPASPDSVLSEDVYSMLGGLQAQLNGLAFLQRAGQDLGSNSWAVSGSLTASGQPLLANDPHLDVELPSIWYEIGLHCVPKNEACPYELTGFSFAGAPAVVIGHNDHIAWGFTNINADVQDVYIEKLNQANPNQYEFEGRWVDMELIPVTIQVAGGEPVEITVRLTRHGPVISDIAYQEFADESGLVLPENYALALRWTALEPGTLYQAILQIGRAANFDEFRQAARLFDVPPQNMIYADVEGNIGYQTPGLVPIRLDHHSGLYPVEGWTGENEWQGFVPFDELPFALNPPEGYLVTANNAIVAPGYPHMLSMEWAPGYRALRIVQMIESQVGPFDPAAFERMHGDNRNLNAERLVPILMQVPLQEDRLTRARALLEDWDHQSEMDSAAAALWEAFWANLLAVTFRDDLPEFHWPSGGGRWFEVVGGMVEDPDHPWWDQADTASAEDRDAMFALALELAVEELEGSLGRDPSAWSWGDLHSLRFTHNVMDSFPLINRYFNAGPFRTGGGSAIVNATGWSARDPYGVRSLPSMRMIVDLGNLGNSRSMHTTGQSGHAGHPHYMDLVEPWRMIDYSPMLWDRATIETMAADHLRLLP